LFINKCLTIFERLRGGREIRVLWATKNNICSGDTNILI